MRWLWIILLLLSCSEEEKKVVRQREPQVPVAQEDILRDDAQAIQVRLGTGEEIMVEGNKMHISEIKTALRSARLAKGDTSTVVIHLQGDSPYGVFAEVHATLEEMLLEDRDSIARKRFDLPYDNLNNTQQTIINRKYHHRIIEKMRR